MSSPAPTIGIITALSYECVAVEHLLDDPSDWVPTSKLGLPARRYVMGTIPAFGGGVHQVALCQVRAGNNRAAIRAAMLKMEFPSIEHLIMVGIAGGAPDPGSPDRHVRLGDIVVSNEYGVVQFDNIKDDPIALEHRHSPRPPSARILDADAVVERAEVRGTPLWEPFIARVVGKGSQWERPAPETDVLRTHGFLNRSFRREISHPNDFKRIAGRPRVFRGVIGSSNSLLKRPKRRDYLRDRFGVRAIEMESSGVADAAWEFEIGYFVVRGVCDYCDRGKNDVWHYYASAVSAAYCRALVEQIPGSRTSVLVPSDGIDKQTTTLAASSAERARELAANLLRITKPREIASLVRDPSEEALAAASEVSALPRMASFGQERELPRDVLSLVTARNGRTAIVAPSGYGKSHAIWHASNDALRAGQVIPIFLPLGDMSSSAELVKLVGNAGSSSLTDLARDDNVVFVLDGWSEFPRDAHAAEIERASVLALLGDRAVVATSRSSADSRFSNAELAPLDRGRVAEIVSKRSSAAVDSTMLELLRHPLALLLYIFLKEETGLSVGRLLAALHRQMSVDASVHEALAYVAFQLVHGRKGLARSTFDYQVTAASSRFGNPRLAEQIVAIGSLALSVDRVVPFHDAYWEWLAGVGALRFGVTRNVAADLSLRRGIRLALESEESPTRDLAEHALEIDSRLAAELSVHLPSLPRSWTDAFATDVSRGLAADEPIIRHHALQAAWSSGTTPISKIAETYVAIGKHWRWLRKLDLEPDRIWELRDELGSQLIDDAWRVAILDVIARDGNRRWIEWLRERAVSGEVPLREAIGAALACIDEVPAWIRSSLVDVVRKEGWCLRAAARRGSNRTLATWVVEHYDQLIVDTGSGPWFHLNGVLSACGTDTHFEELLRAFPTMHGAAQETLGFVIVGLGDTWIARFQEVAFLEGERGRHHELIGRVSRETKEATARGWIRANHWQLQELGWRTLAALRGNEVVAEVIQALPPSFGGVSSCPALEAIVQLSAAPKELVDVIWARMSGTLEPRITERILYALASIRPWGLASLINRMRTGFNLPTYHRMRFLECLKEWETRHGFTVTVQNGSGSITFGEFVMIQSLAKESNDHFVKEAFGDRGYKPATVSAPILDAAAAGDEIARTFVVKLGYVGRYHAELVSAFLAAAEVDPLLDAFGSALNSFPETRLHQVLAKILELGQPMPRLKKLLDAVVRTPSVAHRAFHRALVVASVQKMEGLDVDVLLLVARLLATMPQGDVSALQSELPPLPDERVITMAYLAESFTNAVMIDEGHRWIDRTRDPANV